MKNFTLKTLILLTLAWLWTADVQAQNSTCATAAALVLDTNCGGAPGGPGANSGDPTGNDDTDGNVCSANYSRGDDFIFEYTATSTDPLELDLFATNTWTGLMVTEGCPTTGTCIASSNSSASNESLTTPELVSGVTYYIHISTWPTPQSAGQFCLDAALGTPIMPPVNDACTSPTPLTVNADESCTFITAGTIEAATASGEDEVTCSGTEDDDVWYSFVATAATHTIDLQNVAGSTTDLYHSLWSGSCGALTNVLCSDPNSSTATGLTIGTTYLLRVYSWTATPGQDTDFEVCIGTPPAPPANDDCAGALDYDTTFGPIGASGSCPANTDMLDISNYTDPGDDPTCDFGGDATAWYTWTATATGIDFTSGTGLPGLEVLDGSCGSFTSLGCLNNTSGTISGLTVGITYYLLIWDDGLSGTSLDWCIEGAAGPPANDLCAAAEVIATGGAGMFTAMGTTTGATANDAPVDGCDAAVVPGTGGGVWYTASLDTDLDHVVSLCTGTTWDTEISVYTGSCGALVCGFGNDDECGLQSEVSIPATTSLAPLTYYIYVTGHGTASGDFTLTITSTAPLPVELLSFEGIAEEKSNMLMWKTASEENTEWHIIERSLDGRSDWAEVGREKAAGFTQETQSYMLEDNRPMSKAYYRLRSVDFDGHEDVSEVVFIERRSKAFSVVSIFPNPTKAGVTVDFEVVETQRVTLQMVDLLGKTIAHQEVEAEAGVNTTQFDMSRLASGLYFVNIINETQQLTTRVLKH